MSEIIIRDIKPEDIDHIKNVVREVWDWEGAFKDEDFIEAAVTIYFTPVLHEATFGRVAVLDGNVVGVIFGAVKGEKPQYKHLLDDLTPHILTMIQSKESNRQGMYDYMTYQNQAYEALLDGVKDEYDGVLDFLVLSEAAHGKGIGWKLWLALKKYFEEKNTAKVYVFSDNECNFKFYEKQGFDRRRKTDMLVVFSGVDDATEQYLYEYILR